MTRKSRRVGWVNSFMSEDGDPDVAAPKKCGILTFIALSFIIFKLCSLWTSSNWLVTMYNFDNYPTSFYVSDKGCYVNDSDWCVNPWRRNTVPHFWFAFKVWIFSVFGILGSGLLIVADYTESYDHTLWYNLVWYVKAAYVLCRLNYADILTVIQFDEFHMAETSIIYMLHIAMSFLQEKELAKEAQKEASEDLEPICDIKTSAEGGSDQDGDIASPGAPPGKDRNAPAYFTTLVMVLLTGAYNTVLFIGSVVLSYQWMKKCQVKCPEHEAVSFSGIVEGMYGVDDNSYG